MVTPNPLYDLVQIVVVESFYLVFPYAVYIF